MLRRDTESLRVIHIVLYVGRWRMNCPKLSNEKGVRGRQLGLSLSCMFGLLPRCSILPVDEVASAWVGISENKSQESRIVSAVKACHYHSPAPLNKPTGIHSWISLTPSHPSSFKLQVTHPSCSGIFLRFSFWPHLYDLILGDKWKTTFQANRRELGRGGL